MGKVKRIIKAMCQDIKKFFDGAEERKIKRLQKKAEKMEAKAARIQEEETYNKRIREAQDKINRIKGKPINPKDKRLWEVIGNKVKQEQEIFNIKKKEKKQKQQKMAEQKKNNITFGIR